MLGGISIELRTADRIDIAVSEMSWAALLAAIHDGRYHEKYSVQEQNDKETDSDEQCERCSGRHQEECYESGDNKG